MTHGGSFLTPVTLGPGTYAMICFMPELQAGPMQGAPHFVKGMIRVIGLQPENVEKVVQKLLKEEPPSGGLAF